jgi:hypothetical protein
VTRTWSKENRAEARERGRQDQRAAWCRGAGRWSAPLPTLPPRRTGHPNPLLPQTPPPPPHVGSSRRRRPPPPSPSPGTNARTRPEGCKRKENADTIQPGWLGGRVSHLLRRHTTVTGDGRHRRRRGGGGGGRRRQETNRSITESSTSDHWTKPHRHMAHEGPFRPNNRTIELRAILAQ